jgi:hypothetical protein
MKPSIYFLSRCRVVMFAVLAAFTFILSAEALESVASPVRAAAPADAPVKKSAPAAKKHPRKKRKRTTPPRKTPAKPAPTSSSTR